jgi:hypothetical protein
LDDVPGEFRNPALEWFVHWFGEELVIGQVRVCRRGTSYELRHVADGEKDPAELKPFPAEEGRDIAQFTEAGVLRPLKSAPTLRRGWQIMAGSEAELGTALDRLYPGAIPDLYATLQHPAPATDYRELTSRQSGMYRITELLNDLDAGAVVRKCCAPEWCLKRRFWDVAGFAPEMIERKGIMPCLEPCPILLEFARKVVRATQRENAAVQDVLPGIQPQSSGEEP